MSELCLGTEYLYGDIVKYKDNYYQCIVPHTSAFISNEWKKISINKIMYIEVSNKFFYIRQR